MCYAGRARGRYRDAAGGPDRLQRALEVLEGRDGDHNHWVWIERALPQAAYPRLHEADRLYAVRLQRPPTAASAVRKRVVVASGAAAALTAHAAAAGAVETGGIVIGSGHGERRRLPTSARPGRGHTSVASRFVATPSSCRNCLTGARQSNGQVDYVGEWHDHRALDTQLSRVDKRDLWRIAASSTYETDQPLLLLLETGQDQRAFGPSLSRPSRIVVTGQSSSKSATSPPRARARRPSLRLRAQT